MTLVRQILIALLVALRLSALPIDGIQPKLAKPLQIHSVASGCIESPCVSTVNIPWTTAGEPDQRPGTWGTAASYEVPIQFSNVPVGYSVKINRVYGDFVAWVRGVVAPGSHAGVLFGLLTSSGANPNVEYGSNGCFLYLQGAVGSGEFRAGFDQVIDAGGILPPDNALICQEAIFLDDAGTVHQEATFALVYSFIRSTP